MNLLKKLEIGHDFSQSERIIADYILQNRQETLKLSTIELAKKTYTSPSTIVRLCQKLGYPKYSDFKVSLSASLEYLTTHHHDIDVNYPFKGNDNITYIIKEIVSLFQDSIYETQQLLDSEELKRSISLLDNAQVIDIYGVSGPLRMASDFQYKMFRIGKDVRIAPMINEQLFQAAQSNKNHCAILVSYFGETEEVINAAKILKKRHCPMIGITSIGNNQLSFYCRHILHIDSREQIYNKISTLGSTASIHLIFDILYAGIFSRHYNKSLEYKLTTDHLIDHREKEK